MVTISGKTSLEDCESEEDIEDVLSCSISNTDLVIAVYSGQEELDKVLYSSEGVTGYLKKYWMGFFPLLLVHLDETTPCDPVNELHTCLLANNYSVTHRIIIQDINFDTNFLFQTIVRYHLHVHQLQCNRLAMVSRCSLIPSLSNWQWKCPGLCQLQTVNPDRETRRTKKKKTFFQSVRRTLSVRRATRRIRSRSMHTSHSRKSSSREN